MRPWRPDAESGTVNPGRLAEELACRYLTTHGLVVIERNYRCRRGEIDLIMAEGEEIVFVEVRYRRNARYGSAVESIGPRKRERIVAAAQHFLLKRGRRTPPCRFDVVAVQGGDRVIDWIRNAFEIG